MWWNNDTFLIVITMAITDYSNTLLIRSEMHISFNFDTVRLVCSKLTVVFNMTQIQSTRRVPVDEQELSTLPEHLSSLPVFSGVRITRSLVLCVCFVDSCLSFFFWPLSCLFYSIYGFWLPLWHLQTLQSSLLLSIRY